MCDLQVIKFGRPEFPEVPESELSEFIGAMPPPPKCIRGLGMSFQHAEVRYFAFALQGGHVVIVQRVMQPHNSDSKPRCFIVPPDRLMAGEMAVTEAVISLRNVLERGGHDAHGHSHGGSQSPLQSILSSLGITGVVIIPMDGSGGNN